MEQLHATGIYAPLGMDSDEAEHSLEMQFPFLKAILAAEAKVVPIIVGELSEENEKRFAESLQAFFEQPANVFIASSDFCHWGERFGYVQCGSGPTPPWAWIEKMDRQGCDVIGGLQPASPQKHFSRVFARDGQHHLW